MKKLSDFLAEGTLPKCASGYKQFYKGYDHNVKCPDGKSGAHVFEFDHHNKVDEFLNKVGGAPHPQGGKRAILR